jgi:hypothetical protein
LKADVICVDTMSPAPRDKQLLNFLPYATSDAIFVLDNWADSGVWNDFCGLTMDGLLDKLGLTNHAVEEHLCPGFCGLGTRLILPK